MKIIDCSVMKDGTKIQLEDWRDNNTEKYPDLYGITIGAYPIAQRTSKYGWIEGGKKFRLSIPENKHQGYSNDDVKADYKALKNGEKALQDLADHFWNHEKDMWYLGMCVENKAY